jgi:urea transport system ATP-binding protein
MPLLELNNITAGYGQTPVLFNIDMTINKGDMVCLLGRNGMGKTTLLRSIIGLNKLSKGSLFFNDRDISKIPTYKRSRYGLNFSQC